MRRYELPGLQSLWQTPSHWISDPFGYVFLPRAMREIGKALFPNEWTGDEPVISLALEPTVIALLHSGTSLEWVVIKKAQQEAARIAEQQRQEEERRRQEAVAKAKRAAPVFYSGRRRPLDIPAKTARAYAPATGSAPIKAHRDGKMPISSQHNATHAYAEKSQKGVGMANLFPAVAARKAVVFRQSPVSCGTHRVLRSKSALPASPSILPTPSLPDGRTMKRGFAFRAIA
jgi:hypothetical protein